MSSFVEYVLLSKYVVSIPFELGNWITLLP